VNRMLTDIQLYLDGKEHEVFEHLRRENPVSFQQEPNGPGYFAVMSHADVRKVLMSPKVFVSGFGTALENEVHREGQERSMHSSDAPIHTKLRAVIADKFKREAVADYSGMVREVIGELLDGLPRNESFDFVGRVARRIPMVVIANVMGVPDNMREQIVAWGDLFSDTTAPAEARRGAFVDISRYLPALIEEKKAHPENDVMSALVHGTIDGEPLSFTQILNQFGLLVTAGNETTRFLLAGAMEKLARDPELVTLMRRDDAVIPSAVDEFVRWVTPVRHMRRTAAEDTELGGLPIAKGQKVVVFFASAARDEAVFDCPHEVQFDRPANNHLAFGVGPHFCIGMHLAKLEVVTFFQEFFRRFERVSPKGDACRLPNYWFNGLTKLEIQLS
jgi:cytochrome P450